MADPQISALARLAVLFNALAIRRHDLTAALSPIRVTVALAEAPPPTPAVDPQPGEAATPDLEKHVSNTVARTLGEQVSIGGVLGFATGYSIRKIGKAVMFVVGTEVAILQYMAYRQWLVMDWRKLARDISPNFSKSAWDKVLDILLYKMPFNVAFTGGLFAGLRLSVPK